MTSHDTSPQDHTTSQGTEKSDVAAQQEPPSEAAVGSRGGAGGVASDREKGEADQEQAATPHSDKVSESS